MLRTLRNNQPVHTPAIQYSGGEPTVREDIVDLIKLAKEEGFTHTQIATNGLALAKNPQLAIDLKEAGLNTVYLQFDGITEEIYLKTRNANILDKKMEAIENCRKANLGIVLVPTLLKGINDHQTGDIIKFALNNLDVIKGVNFQPVSFAGRTPADEVEQQRVTIPDFLKMVEKQANISVESFYPASSVAPISNLVSKLTDGEPQVTLTCHQNCGAGTYVFKDGDKIIPVTDFIDIEKFIKLINKTTDNIGDGGRRSKVTSVAKASVGFSNVIDSSKSPSQIDMKKLLKEVLLKHDYEALGDFHENALLISCMHFMDPWNFDQDRVRRCVIHYAVPDGRIIPFCSMNNIYREDIEKEFAIPFDQLNNKIKQEIESENYTKNSK